MKYDASGKPSRAAARTLAAFSGALFALLERKPFEAITVRELCDTADYPRSTFYNYFDDLDDFLGYCWDTISRDLREKKREAVPTEEGVWLLFDDMYDAFSENRASLARIFTVNKAGGKLIESLTRSLKQSLAEAVAEYAACDGAPIPAEMLAEHLSNILQLVFEWSFLREDGLSREEAVAALRYLVSGRLF